MFYKFITGCLLLLLAIISTIAQRQQFQFTRIDISQGLSHNQINCIFKHKKGFVWFGTMSGLIRVESAPDQGSCFIIRMPVAAVPGTYTTATPVLVTEEIADKTLMPHLNGSSVAIVPSGKKPVILLIKDNEDFPFYLKDNLSDSYKIIEAVNGREGWQLALGRYPDLIVSDVNMPEMNDIDLCRKIKNDSRTNKHCGRVGALLKYFRYN